MINVAFHSTWAYPNHGESKASDVKAAEDMTLSQSLRTCFRSNVVDKRRLCHTGLHMGLFNSSHFLNVGDMTFLEGQMV